MGVNGVNEFVCFVRFFLMNKSYIFCTLSGITLYNNHTPTPPDASGSIGHSYLIHRILRFFFGFFLFFSSLHNYWIYFITYLLIYDF